MTINEMTILYNVHFRFITRSFSTCKPRFLHRDMLPQRFMAAELFKKRKEDKQRKKTTLNSADFHVIGAQCQGHMPSLLVNSGGDAYLFNCSEGFQRNCYVNGVKLTNLGHLFVTNLDWSRISGAYGLSLTLQDLGATSFTVHGTESVGDFFKSVSSFLSFNSGIDCKTNICNDGVDYKDSSITVKSVILDNDTCSEFRNGSNKRLKKFPRLISYICALPELPGSLDPQKCRELKVPIGPKLAILKSGHDITLDDGTVVKSSDVCGPKSREIRFIVIDCPSPDDIDLVTRNVVLEQQRQLRLAKDNDQIDMVIHFSPEVVCGDKRYSRWMDGFSDDCKHILLANNRQSRPNFTDSYRLQKLLQKVDKDLFPRLNLPEHLDNQMRKEFAGAQRINPEQRSTEVDDSELRYECMGSLKDLERFYQAATLDRFTIRPKAEIKSVETKPLVDTFYRDAWVLLDDEEEFEIYDNWREEQPPPAAHEPEIVFLGTGSALPSNLRNTSCILINTMVPKRASIIMDCGEDSYGQLVRFYGHDGANEILSHVQLIYISHHHADHHIGLIRILSQMMKVTRDKPVLLLAPPGIDTQLNYYNYNFEDLRSTYRLMSTRSLKSIPGSSNGSKISLLSTVEFVRSHSDNLIRDIRVVGVEHCSHACAVTMELNIDQLDKESFKVAYSGDARPSDDFVSIGQDCDLLIHEATFEPREQDKALEKKHCTSSEAIKISKRMRAKHTILTHFSQRYPKIPYFTDEFDETVGYAFDNMAIRCPSHNARLPKMKKVLSKLFIKSLDSIDEKYTKKMERQEMVAKFAQCASSSYKNE